MKFLKKMHFSNKKILCVAVALSVMVCAGLSVTLAYFIAKSGAVKNTFTSAIIDVEIKEDFKDGDAVKKNVKVTNNGSAPAYIRAAVVVNYADADGNVSANKPVENTDYSMELGESWIKIGNYYYYPSPVAPDGATENLIDECAVLKDKGVYSLDVRILAEGIQATPASAVQEAWGITPRADGTLAK